MWELSWFSSKLPNEFLGWYLEAGFVNIVFPFLLFGSSCYNFKSFEEAAYIFDGQIISNNHVALPVNCTLKLRLRIFLHKQYLRINIETICYFRKSIFKKIFSVFRHVTNITTLLLEYSLISKRFLHYKNWWRMKMYVYSSFITNYLHTFS